MPPTTKPLSQHLADRLAQLRSLLQNLPHNLPLNPPESSYHFSLPPEDIEERGIFGAVSRCLEICLGQNRGGTTRYTERGPRLEAMVDMLKSAVEQMGDGDREATDSAWLERLITSALDMGARVPKRKQWGTTAHSESPAVKKIKSTDSIVITDSESDASESSTHPLRTTTSSSSFSSLLSAPKMKQGKLSFTKDTRTDAQKQADRQRTILRDSELRVKREANAAAEKEQKKQRKKELAQKRQQRHRKKLRDARTSDFQSEDNQLSDVSGQPSNSANHVVAQRDLASISRPGFEEWRENRNGARGGKEQNKAVRTNWFHPFLWVGIDAAMRKADWSCEDAVKILHRERPELYGKLTRGVVWKWKVKGESEWTQKTNDNIEKGHTPVASGRAGPLAKSPELVQQIKTTLQGLRTTGLVVNATLARSIILGLIQERQPDILNEKFRCTEWFVRSFLQSVMGWTPRAGTRAAAHLPANADDLCERTFFRLAYCMKWENIPAKLVINMDQQGIYVLPNSTKTFHTKGDSQVDILGKEEKRAFTILVASTAAGDFLPIQSVWGGKTKNSLPKQSAAGMDEALASGFHFTAAASETSARSHFSTFKTMKEWIENILIPYIRSVIVSDPSLDDDQKAILFIDVYPVHTGQPFRAFVFTEYPNIIIIFVPANCTGKYQPADVGIQRPLKHRIKAALFNWLAGVHREQLAAGAKPEEIRITSSLPKLRDASVAPLVEAYKFMKTPEGKRLILKAWEQCTAKGYNLSEACLTSKDTIHALNTYLRSDPTLHDEIQARCGQVFGIADESAIEMDTDQNNDFHDDLDIPFDDVVANTFRERNGTHEAQDGLVGTAEEENIWSYNDDGNLWSASDTLPVA